MWNPSDVVEAHSIIAAQYWREYNLQIQYNRFVGSLFLIVFHSEKASYANYGVQQTGQ